MLCDISRYVNDFIKLHGEVKLIAAMLGAVTTSGMKLKLFLK
jgi:hypothetical protein